MEISCTRAGREFRKRNMLQLVHAMPEKSLQLAKHGPKNLSTSVTHTEHTTKNPIIAKESYGYIHNEAHIMYTELTHPRCTQTL